MATRGVRFGAMVDALVLISEVAPR